MTFDVLRTEGRADFLVLPGTKSHLFFWRKYLDKRRRVFYGQPGESALQMTEKIMPLGQRIYKIAQRLYACCCFFFCNYLTMMQRRDSSKFPPSFADASRNAHPNFHAISSPSSRDTFRFAISLCFQQVLTWGCVDFLICWIRSYSPWIRAKDSLDEIL
jgi:hypothetical protein